jgi:hypothetical protein
MEARRWGTSERWERVFGGGTVGEAVGEVKTQSARLLVRDTVGEAVARLVTETTI